MSENHIIKHCAPTLAGIKTGNLFTTSYESIDRLDEEINCLNMRLSSKDLRVVRLRARDNRALIYVYRPGKLAADLDRDDAKAILNRSGYRQVTGPEEHIDRLSERVFFVNRFSPKSPFKFPTFTWGIPQFHRCACQVTSSSLTSALFPIKACSIR